MTLSLAGLCPRTGEMGCALATSSMAGGARAMYVAPGYGVVLSQARSDPTLGVLGLKRLAAGRTAQEVVSDMIAATPHSAWRQFAALDREGRVAHFTGDKTLPAKGGREGRGVVAVGNAVANHAVISAMVEGFTASGDRPLGERLVVALEYGRDQGGESNPLRSAALKIIRPGVPFAVVDLRVDFSATPVEDLRRYWETFAPIADAYVQRALDPEHSKQAADIEGHAKR